MFPCYVSEKMNILGGLLNEFSPRKRINKNFKYPLSNILIIVQNQSVSSSSSKALYLLIPQPREHKYALTETRPTRLHRMRDTRLG